MPLNYQALLKNSSSTDTHTRRQTKRHPSETCKKGKDRVPGLLKFKHDCRHTRSTSKHTSGHEDDQRLPRPSFSTGHKYQLHAMARANTKRRTRNIIFMWSWNVLKPAPGKQHRSAEANNTPQAGPHSQTFYNNTKTETYIPITSTQVSTKKKVLGVVGDIWIVCGQVGQCVNEGGKIAPHKQALLQETRFSIKLPLQIQYGNLDVIHSGWELFRLDESLQGGQYSKNLLFKMAAPAVDRRVTSTA